MADSDVKSRIDHALRVSKKGRTDLANQLGISRGSVSDMLNREGDPPIKYVEATAELTGYRLEWLMNGSGPERSDELKAVNRALEREAQYHSNTLGENEVEYLKGKKIRIVTATVDRHGNDMMVFVPVKAQAGYQRGHGDPQYLEKLPAFSLPILKSGQYRMFEVDGESMRQIGGGGLHDGDIVVSQYVEDIFSMRDKRVYVVISTDGVLVKRCLNRLMEKDNPVLVLQSDNKNGQYPDIILRPPQIIEVWELKAFISKQLAFATDLWKVVGDLEVQIAQMNEKIDRISTDRLLPG